jgi:hypothetical protein
MSAQQCRSHISLARHYGRVQRLPLGQQQLYKGRVADRRLDRGHPILVDRLYVAISASQEKPEAILTPHGTRYVGWRVSALVRLLKRWPGLGLYQDLEAVRVAIADGKVSGRLSSVVRCLRNTPLLDQGLKGSEMPSESRHVHSCPPLAGDGHSFQRRVLIQKSEDGHLGVYRWPCCCFPCRCFLAHHRALNLMKKSESAILFFIRREAPATVPLFFIRQI